jgi:hypothetical protein
MYISLIFYKGCEIMAQMTYVCLYLDYLDSFRGLSDAACGKLVKAMLHYALTGEDSQLAGPARILWPSIRSQMERDGKKYLQRCETNRINGAKGGRPTKNPSVILETEGFFEKPKKAKEKEKEKDKEKNNDNVNEKANENANANEKEKEKENPVRQEPAVPRDWETELFAQRAEKIRRAKGGLEDREAGSLTPLGIPEYLRAGSSEPDRWLPV